VHHSLQETQGEAVLKKLGPGNLSKLLKAGDTWTIS
jgi:hypothetical protein